MLIVAYVMCINFESIGRMNYTNCATTMRAVEKAGEMNLERMVDQNDLERFCSAGGKWLYLTDLGARPR